MGDCSAWGRSRSNPQQKVGAASRLEVGASFLARPFPARHGRDKPGHDELGDHAGFKTASFGSAAADAPPPRVAPAPIDKRDGRDGVSGRAAPGSRRTRRSGWRPHPGLLRLAGRQNANVAVSATTPPFACVRLSSNAFKSVHKYLNTLKKSATHGRYFTTN